MSKRNSFFYYSLLSSSLCISHHFLLLSIFLLLTQFYKTALNPHFSWDFTLCPSPNGRMALLYISSSFSSFLPSTCLTSLTSHLHLRGLTFVHPFINVARLLYIIIEKKMNPILFFRSSYFNKPISHC